MDSLFDKDITGNINNPPKHIKGIVCSVKKCMYHDTEGYCTANVVNIGNSDSLTASDTVCATFRARN